eukprot:6019506-Pleurochrysis_carterae.AAC.2
MPWVLAAQDLQPAAASRAGAARAPTSCCSPETKPLAAPHCRAPRSTPTGRTTKRHAYGTAAT